MNNGSRGFLFLQMNFSLNVGYKNSIGVKLRGSLLG